MADIGAVLMANRQAVDELIAAAEQAGPGWATPRAPGKWSPSQVVEHVAMALEESAKVVQGMPSRFPTVPGFLRPLLRGMFFNRVVRKGTFFKAKTNAAMDPATGPATPAEARPRLEGALRSFDAACRASAAADGRVPSTAFGDVAVADYARFTELHTRHHTKQIPAGR